MQSKPKTVEQYLASLPEDRRKALSAVRRVIKKNLGKGYEEGIQYGIIGYYVPHSVFPDGYHCDPKQPLPFAGLASQKNYMSLYLMCVYSDAESESWFRQAWKKTGKKLDMGKACVRFKKLEDVPLDVIGKTIKRNPSKDFIARYESLREEAGKAAGARKKKASKKKASKKKALKKKPSKKSSKKAVKKTAAKKATKKKSTGKKKSARRSG